MDFHAVLQAGKQAVRQLGNLGPIVSHCMELKKQFQQVQESGDLQNSDKIWKTWAMMREHLSDVILDRLGGSSAEPSPVTVNHPQQSDILSAIKEFQKRVAGLRGPVRVQHVAKAGYKEGFQRSYFEPTKNNVFLRDNPDQATVFHELGHVLEDRVPGLQAAAVAFLKSRVQGPAFRVAGHEADEKFKDGGFPDFYFGKQESGSTDIISLGLQYLAEDPATLWQDKELFTFVLGSIMVARGEA